MKRESTTNTDQHAYITKKMRFDDPKVSTINDEKGLGYGLKNE